MLQLRDLRLLDPQLATSYPSAILARERALVVNLEYIKCIITQDCVLLLNPGAPPIPYARVRFTPVPCMPTRGAAVRAPPARDPPVARGRGSAVILKP